MRIRHLVPLATVVAGLLAPAAAVAATPTTSIASAGPLTAVSLGNELSCQVQRSGALQLYPNNRTPADCGTFAAYDGTLYKPDFASHGNTATSGLGGGTVVTPVSQSAVSGAGTSGDPYVVTTVVTAGSKLRLTQKDRYITGNDYWTTDVSVTNLTTDPLSTNVYRAMDCYLGGSDEGYGFEDPASGGAGCSANAGNSPVGLIEGLIPASGHTVRRYQAGYSSVWRAVGTKGDLANSCACTSQIDNGVALQWALSLTPQQTQVVSFNTVFDPAGDIPAPPPGRVPPSPTSSPTVPATPAPAVGSPYSASPGTWDDPAATQSYQWQRCTSAAASSCVDIAGATSSTYTPTLTDAGTTLRLVQTATNADGAASASSGQSAPVIGPPTSTSAPVAGTTATQGTVLHGQPGSWTDASTTSLQWQRCASADPASCVDIASATSADYTPTHDDAGSFLRLVETATNAGGSSTAASALTDRITGLPPTLVNAPTLSSSQPTHAGQAVAADRGTWTDADNYTYQWQRCLSTDPSTCQDITDATAVSYAATAEDVGSLLRLQVTAINLFGSTTATTPLGDRVLPAPPTVITAPGGTPTGTTDGGLEAVSPETGTAIAPALGSFDGATSVTYQYQRCATDDPSSCVDIPGATDPTYTPTAEDVGFRLRLVATATNDGGSVQSFSALSRAVTARPATQPAADPTPTTPASPTDTSPAAGVNTPPSTATTPAQMPTATTTTNEPATAPTPAPAASTSMCLSRRSVTLHWQLPTRARITAYDVSLNGKRYATLRGTRHGVNVRMNGRPAQQVVVQVTARAASGRRWATTRTYHTCTGARLGATLKTLTLQPQR